jgi:uncharacterized protein
LKRKIEILQEKKKYIAFFPDVYHFFPCSKDQAEFLEKGIALEGFQQKMDSLISLKEKELLEERQLKKNAEAKKNVEIFGKENPLILGRLIINPTSRCNLNCKYCYNYNYWKTGGMSFEIALAALDNLYRMYEAVRVIHFIGGEPLLNIQLIESVCSWISQRFQEKFIKILPVFAVVTNGTVADPHIIETLKKFKIQVVVSVDGGQEVNDVNRVYPNGKGSYHTIYKNFHRFAKAGLEPKIQVTYNK